MRDQAIIVGSAALTVALLAVPVAAAVAQARTELISVALDGRPGDFPSYNSGITPDGRYVVFTSQASNLVAGDTNEQLDIFVRDRLARTTRRVSLADGGGEANGGSFKAAISADGKVVAFSSLADNLVAGDEADELVDLFVRDLVAGTTRKVNVGENGRDGYPSFDDFDLSGDGRYVVFTSSDPLVAGDPDNLSADAFVHDRRTGAISLVTIGPGGERGVGERTRNVQISRTGRFVAFVSASDRLVAGDTNGTDDVFLRDRRLGRTTRVSIAADGTQAGSSSDEPAVSAFGRFVAFSTFARLTPREGSGADVYVRDRHAHTTTVVSLSAFGRVGGGYNVGGVTGDGRCILFGSTLRLVRDDTDFKEDLYVRDRALGRTERVSVGTGGSQGNGRYHELGGISADCGAVAFSTDAGNMVRGDTNMWDDVFVRVR